MAISYDSKLAIAIVKESELTVRVAAYCLTTYAEVWRNDFEGSFVRLNMIEQNNKGSVFAFAWQDNGTFYVRVLNNEGKVISDKNVSELMKVLESKEDLANICDEQSTPIPGQDEPLITCCFINLGELFVSVYHKTLKTQVHFTYKFIEDEVSSELYSQNIEICSECISTVHVPCSENNFPIKSFYSEENNECYTFFRQGQGFVTTLKDISFFWVQKLSEHAFGSMFMLYGQALITRCSDSM
jgi:hypothetical protein